MELKLEKLEIQFKHLLEDVQVFCGQTNTFMAEVVKRLKILRDEHKVAWKEIQPLIDDYEYRMEQAENELFEKVKKVQKYLM
jgi:hypothetical protein